MKKYLYILMAFLVSTMGCNKDSEYEPSFSAGQIELSLSSDSPYITIGDGSADALFRARGGEIAILVHTDQSEWSYEKSDDALWLTVANEDYYLYLSAGENSSEKELSAGVTVTATDGKISKSVKISVTQHAQGDVELEVSPLKVELSANSTEEVRIDVTTNQEDFDFHSNTNWIYIEKAEDHITITPEANPDPEDRRTIINITAGLGEKTDTEYVVVTQKARASVGFDRRSFTFVDEGGSGEVSVTTNQEDWDYVDPGLEWLNIERKNDLLQFEVSQSFITISRSAEIEVFAGEGDNIARETITIEQFGYVPEKMIITLTIPAEMTIAALPVAGTVDCTIDWGDGTVQDVTTANPTHQYEEAGIYNVVVTGTVTALSSQSIATARKPFITAVKQWGLTGLTSMANAFHNCQHLTEIPPDRDGSFSEVTTFSYAFYSNQSLSRIPDGLFTYAAKAEIFNYLFYQGYLIEEIPERLLDNCVSAKNFSNAFSYCTKLTRLPAGLMDNCTEATNMSYAFAYNQIEEIPREFFDKTISVTDFSGVFADNKITEIDPNLFANCPEVTTFVAALRGNDFATVPAGLFAANKKADNFNSAFMQCLKLKSFPAGVFPADTPFRNAMSMFSGCTALETIEQGAFDNFTDVTSFNNFFQDCAALRTVPSGLFANSAKATNYNRIFYNCSGLETVPGDIFNGAAVTGANSNNIFYGCAGLKRIGSGLFDTFVKATAMNNQFYGCVNLEEIPEGLFDKCENVTTFNQVFYGCSSLSTIPRALFDNNAKAINFGKSFYGCTNLAGPSPYAVTTGGDIPLYLREPANGYTKPTTFAGCFALCTALTDYALMASTYPDWIAE